jgi:predicted nucleic acid-binding protein
MSEHRHRVYLDTSSYLSLLLDEEAAVDLRSELDVAEVLSSVLLIVEARRNLVRLAREGSVTREHYQAATERVALDMRKLVLRDVTLDLCEPHPLPAVATPKSIDLIHLHTALWFHRAEPVDRFLTMDAAQRDAARELGLHV